MATANSYGFVACSARTMKPVLNGTDYIPSKLMELSRSFLREFQEAS